MPKIKVFDGDPEKRPIVRVLPDNVPTIFTRGVIWGMSPYEAVQAIRQHLKTAITKGRYAVEDRYGEAFLNDPLNTIFNTTVLASLCYDLNITNSAFYAPNKHWRYLTDIKGPANTPFGRLWQSLRGQKGGITREYDPTRIGIQKRFTQEFLEEPLYLVLSPDLREAYAKERGRMPDSAEYSFTDFLVNMGYHCREDFADRIGRIQFDAVNCGPLVLYAAAQSSKPRIICKPRII